MDIKQEILEIVKQEIESALADAIIPVNVPDNIEVDLKNYPDTKIEVPDIDFSGLERALTDFAKKLTPKDPSVTVHTDLTRLEQLIEGLSSDLTDKLSQNNTEELIEAIRENRPLPVDLSELVEVTKQIADKPTPQYRGGAIGPSKKYLMDTTGKAINPAKLEWQVGYKLQNAIDQVFDTFGDTVSVIEKKKTLRKFGRNGDVGTAFETVWRTGGDETYATTNAIDKISSSDNGDTQEVVIEGHTISNGVLTFVTQTHTLEGQTESALTTPLARCTRVYNNGTTDFAGTIYVYEDDTVTNGVPQTTSKIHLTVSAGTNQSEKASTSVSNTDYWFITEFEGHCFDKSAAIVEFEVQVRTVGTTNKVFRRIYETAGTNGQPTIEQFDPVLIIPKNSDVRVRVKADNASTDIGAALSGYLAKVV